MMVSVGLLWLAVGCEPWPEKADDPCERAPFEQWNPWIPADLHDCRVENSIERNSDSNGCLDADNDGFCANTDCDDTDPTASVWSTLFPDCDGDGEPSTSMHQGCGDPSVHTSGQSACSGGPAFAWSDSRGEDCDDDDADAVDFEDWFADCDADGFTELSSERSCGAPTCSSGPGAYQREPTEPWDCDDSSEDIYPGADEVPDDSEDQDCDGMDLNWASLYVHVATPNDGGDDSNDGSWAAPVATIGRGLALANGRVIRVGWGTFNEIIQGRDFKIRGGHDPRSWTQDLAGGTTRLERVIHQAGNADLDGVDLIAATGPPILQAGGANPIGWRDGRSEGQTGIEVNSVDLERVDLIVASGPAIQAAFGRVTIADSQVASVDDWAVQQEGGSLLVTDSVIGQGTSLDTSSASFRGISAEFSSTVEIARSHIVSRGEALRMVGTSSLLEIRESHLSTVEASEPLSVVYGDFGSGTVIRQSSLVSKDSAGGAPVLELASGFSSTVSNSYIASLSPTSAGSGLVRIGPGIPVNVVFSTLEWSGPATGYGPVLLDIDWSAPLRLIGSVLLDSAEDSRLLQSNGLPTLELWHAAFDSPSTCGVVLDGGACAGIDVLDSCAGLGANCVNVTSTFIGDAQLTASCGDGVPAPLPTSPLMDAAPDPSALSLPVGVDIAGTLRPQGTGWEPGACEMPP